MKEEWRDIVGYEEKYQVSNLGEVKSLNYKRTKKEKILKTGKNTSGYSYVNLCKDGKKKTYHVHRLVAQAFIPNPNNYSEVNHKDENKENNCVKNLEWCDRKYNCNYGTRNKKASKAISGKNHPMYGKHHSEETKRKISKANEIPVYCVELDRVFNSCKECAEELGLNRGNICHMLKGKRKTTGGYHFRYEEGESENDISHEI